MREPYASATILPLREQSFLHEHSLDGLTLLLDNHPEWKDVIEVGSWLGGSAKLIGEKLRDRKGTLTCVDPWEGYDQMWREERHFPTIYRQFLSNMVHWGLQETVVPVRAQSPAAAEVVGTADMIYIDGYHSREAVRADVLAWYPHLHAGGVLCGDDYAWTGVADGIAEACEQLGVAVPQPVNDFWELKPKEAI